MDIEEQIQCNANTDSNISDSTNPTVTDKKNSKINYFLQGPNQDADRRSSAKIMQQLHKEFKDVFTGISCFDGTFSLKIKDRKSYQEPPRCMPMH